MARDTLIREVRDWAAGLPVGLASLKEESSYSEHVVLLEPSNPRSCRVEFRFSNYETFGLYFGRGFAFEEIPSEPALVRDVCESIRAGRVEETVWTRWGCVLRTKGVLRTFSSGSLWDNGSRSPLFFLGFRPLATKRVIHYEPWS